MKFRNTLACTFAALAVAGGAAGTAQAADDDTKKFANGSQVVSCDVIEILDQPNLSSADNNVDCSENVKEEESELVHVVNDVLFPRPHEYR
ncbi:hypothetical protein LUX12_21925 [Streptomyces somaliensis]|uniref:hypothetical protein n=1 Tax=Streptomyces somaliensis TaxID=78355 RepID=UPI0020CD1689|nr:hypothetical protein [Streptomyces somaliensis]MCP9946861.1 hypothetical protein [Streptomyces somaliensis]MCP9963500.1 hypothetical protein [Streptomyces somaliensis]MCP9976226.1 hypothetical protein [Streptomyces somaliensis]MCQ0025548.1 hypothetical protein [Streptomyces somaliensis DSM 40738]